MNPAIDEQEGAERLLECVAVRLLRFKAHFNDLFFHHTHAASLYRFILIVATDFVFHYLTSSTLQFLWWRINHSVSHVSYKSSLVSNCLKLSMVRDLAMANMPYLLLLVVYLLASYLHYIASAKVDWLPSHRKPFANREGRSWLRSSKSE